MATSITLHLTGFVNTPPPEWAKAIVYIRRPRDRHSRVSGNPERYCVRQVGCWQGATGFPLTREWQQEGRAGRSAGGEKDGSRSGRRPT